MYFLSQRLGKRVRVNQTPYRFLGCTVKSGWLRGRTSFVHIKLKFDIVYVYWEAFCAELVLAVIGKTFYKFYVVIDYENKLIMLNKPDGENDNCN